MAFFTRFLSALLTVVVAVDMAVQAASLQQVTNFGDNPSGARMFIYVPDNVAATPAIVVAIHYCTGTASAYYNGTPYKQLADNHRFIVIYPESPYSGGCWDVSSPATLTYEGGGNSNAIANMVRWTQERYNGSPNRVYATGTSSGAMMTNILAATYPDMFAACTVYAGVPAGCFYTGSVNGWNSSCANGQVVTTQQAWAQTALNMRPGYTGRRPSMQIYHGGQDNIIHPPNYRETIKQWSGVLGLPETPSETRQGPSAQFRREVYGTRLQGLFAANLGHDLPIQGEEDMRWFGIAAQAPPPDIIPMPDRCTRSGLYGQCGGQGFTGCDLCVHGTTCEYYNEWYSQCL